ncbi:MAG: hypothetical protein CMM48_10360 [Rhodospirillaceae bacterium]|nr:hypothetical protein [Rhodospirillaceae bacterium]|tara:strand:- start:7 stop:762 length:756 start_codon:yes stop_codon:yes gene_type:complete
MRRIRGYFFAGVLVTMPLAITFAVARWFILFVDSKIVPMIPAAWNPDTYLKEHVGFEIGLPGLGVVVLLIAITLIGALTAGFIGRFVIKTGENLLARMPVIRSVYGSVKQILETVLQQQSQAFRQAVLVEYPRRGIWAVGFITGETEGEVQNLTNEEVTNVFLPTTPNPTSGFLLFVPREDLVVLDMTVEEAVKMVISGGIVTPPDRRSEEEQKISVVSARTYEQIDIDREKDGGTRLTPTEHHAPKKASS